MAPEARCARLPVWGGPPGTTSHMVPFKPVVGPVIWGARAEGVRLIKGVFLLLYFWFRVALWEFSAFTATES